MILGTVATIGPSYGLVVVRARRVLKAPGGPALVTVVTVEKPCARSSPVSSGWDRMGEWMLGGLRANQ